MRHALTGEYASTRSLPYFSLFTYFKVVKAFTVCKINYCMYTFHIKLTVLKKILDVTSGMKLDVDFSLRFLKDT